MSNRGLRHGDAGPQAQLSPETVTKDGAPGVSTTLQGPALAEELRRAIVSFEYFLRHHIFIRDVQPDGTTRVVQWQWWPFHATVLADLTGHDRLIALKARQLGFSWLLAALHVHGALFTQDYIGGVTSITQGEATKFLDKCRFIVDHLPYAMSLAKSNTEELRFKATAGCILAFASTADAGRGDSFNRFVADEAAFHDYAEANFAAYEPATEHGQIIIVSSAGDEDGQAANDWFRRQWYAAQDGRNGFTARFYGYDLRPGRDAEWRSVRQARLSSRPGAFEREYPRTVEEAFRSLQAQRFDVEAMAAARERCHLPLMALRGVPAELSGPDNARHLRVWSQPRPGQAYVAYTDAAEGKGRDYCATVVLEARTLRHVATLRDNVLEPSQHGVLALALVRWYNGAYYGFERNKGEAIAYAVGTAHYGRVYWHQEQPTQRQRREGAAPVGRIGFPVTEHTRPALLDDLAVAIQTGALESPDAGFWDECAIFIVRNGRPEAATGQHDDMVMAMAGAVRMARQQGATTMTTRVVRRGNGSYRYQDPGAA